MNCRSGSSIVDNTLDLDLSYRMDLDLWDCLGRGKLIAKFHRTDLFSNL